MDALTPPTPVAGLPAPAPLPTPAPAARPAPEVPSPTAAPTEPLPALPAAVQRHQIEPPTPKVMTREQMLDLLSLL